MISSTSWTPDEDFNMLFNSMIKIEEDLSILEKEKEEQLNQKKPNDYNKNNQLNIRKILFIITGRGPQKEYYMNKINKTEFKYFIVKSIWLESDDYPKILGSVDLGVCLHYSSSGFDLPMKVVDMFASQLPVCAVYYETIRELVKENFNGYLFKDENELQNLLLNIIKEFSAFSSFSLNSLEEKSFVNEGHKELNKFSRNLKEFGEYDWITQWDEKAKGEINRII
jgi:beta-1,4-mannosyltransferase